MGDGTFGTSLRWAIVYGVGMAVAAFYVNRAVARSAEAVRSDGWHRPPTWWVGLGLATTLLAALPVALGIHVLREGHLVRSVLLLALGALVSAGAAYFVLAPFRSGVRLGDDALEVQRVYRATQTAAYHTLRGVRFGAVSKEFVFRTDDGVRLCIPGSVVGIVVFCQGLAERAPDLVTEGCPEFVAATQGQPPRVM